MLYFMQNISKFYGIHENNLRIYLIHDKMKFMLLICQKLHQEALRYNFNGIKFSLNEQDILTDKYMSLQEQQGFSFSLNFVIMSSVYLKQQSDKNNHF